MGKKLKFLMKTIYENDVVTLDDYENAYFTPPIEEMLKSEDLEVKKFIRKDKKIKREAKKKTTEESSGCSISINLSKVSVKSHCNKCKEVIYGELLNMIYHPEGDLMNPFFSYHCEKCGHVGKRSDYSLALLKDTFLKYYKIND